MTVPLPTGSVSYVILDPPDRQIAAAPITAPTVITVIMILESFFIRRYFTIFKAISQWIIGFMPKSPDEANKTH
jgi:hypothetical protein